MGIRQVTQSRISVEQYLEQVATFTADDYGSTVRTRFQDIRGDSELAMLASPTPQELDQLKRAVAIMTPAEKQNAAALTDEQIRRIADDAHADPAVLAIFFNGYALHCKHSR